MSGTVVPFPGVPLPPGRPRRDGWRAELRLWLLPWRTVRLARQVPRYEEDLRYMVRAWGDYIQSRKFR